MYVSHIYHEGEKKLDYIVIALLRTIQVEKSSLTLAV